MSRTVRSLVAGVALLLATPAFGIEWAGRTWNTFGRSTEKVQRIGSARSDQVNLVLHFDPTTFEVRDSMGAPLFGGTYALDARGGPVLDPDPTGLAAFLTARVEALLVQEGLTGTVSGLVVDRTKLRVRGKGTTEGVALAFQASFRGRVAVDVTAPAPANGEVAFSVAVKTAGILPADVASTSWFGTGTSRTSARGYGNRGAGRVQVDFGPGGGLAAGEYSFLDVESSIEIRGAYAQNGTTTVTLAGIGLSLASSIEALAKLVLGENVSVRAVLDQTTFSYRECVDARIDGRYTFEITVVRTGQVILARSKIRARLEPQ